MAIQRSTMIDDDGSGTTGTILNNAWLQDIYNRIDLYPGVVPYTPTWTSSGTAPVLGNGTVQGWYTIAGLVVNLTLRIVIGSTTTVGTGVWFFTLPPIGSHLGTFVLSAELFDSAVGSYVGIGSVSGPSGIVVYAAGAPNGVGATAPFTWKTNDKLHLSGHVLYT